MITLIAKYYAKPGKGGDVIETLKKMAPLVKEREPGCKLYHANVAKDNADFILLYEQYENQADVENHRETEHYKEHIAGTCVPMLEKREVEFFEHKIG